MDLAPKAGSVDPAYRTPGFVPGWTADPARRKSTSPFAELPFPVQLKMMCRST